MAAHRPRRGMRSFIDHDDRRGAERIRSRAARRAGCAPEACRDPHPVEGALDMRQADNRGAHIRRHTPAEAVDLAAQRAAWLRHHVDGRALPRLHSREVGLAEIADRVPVLGVDDREQRVAGGGELPSGDVERGDPAIAGCTHDRLVEVALCERERRARAFQLRLGGLGVGDGLARLVRLQLRLLQRDLRGALRRARLVDLLRGDKPGPSRGSIRPSVLAARDRCASALPMPRSAASALEVCAATWSAVRASLASRPCTAARAWSTRIRYGSGSIRNSTSPLRTAWLSRTSSSTIRPLTSGAMWTRSACR